MFYDLEDPSLFVKSIENFLNENGIWIFEVSYMPEMLRLNSFDTICHEHLEYYSLTVIKKILSKNGMKLANVELNSSNGGSIRCFVVKNNCEKFQNSKNTNKIRKLLEKETKLKLETNEPYLKFKKNIRLIRSNLIKLIKALNKKKINSCLWRFNKGQYYSSILQFK